MQFIRYILASSKVFARFTRRFEQPDFKIFLNKNVLTILLYLVQLIGIMKIKELGGEKSEGDPGAVDYLS